MIDFILNSFAVLFVLLVIVVIGGWIIVNLRKPSGNIGSAEGHNPAVKYAGRLYEDTWYRQVTEAHDFLGGKLSGRHGRRTMTVRVPFNWYKYNDPNVNNAMQDLLARGADNGVAVEYYYEE